MITENVNPAEELDPKDAKSTNETTPSMGINSNDEDEDDTDDDTDDDGDYEILPSNDSGISADDNAATGKMHEKEGE